MKVQRIRQLAEEIEELQSNLRASEAELRAALKEADEPEPKPTTLLGRLEGLALETLKKSPNVRNIVLARVLYSSGHPKAVKRVYQVKRRLRVKGLI